MRKLLLFITVLSLGTTYAQQDQNANKLILEKGTWFLGGNVAFNTSNWENEIATGTAENDRFNFSFNSKAGHFLGDNFLLGLGIGYRFNDSESTNQNVGSPDNTNESNSQTLSLFPFVRGYKALGQKLALFLEAEARYSRGWSESTINNRLSSETTSNELFIGLRPGITYFATKNLALEANIGVLGYNHVSSERENFDVAEPNNLSEQTSNSFDVSLNPSNLFLGLSYYF